MANTRIVLALALVLAPEPAAAETALSVSRPDPIDILNWDQASLRGGYSAYGLLGAEVRGPRGQGHGRDQGGRARAANARVHAAVIEFGGLSAASVSSSLARRH
ncbi:MAG TPA: hypothetical protein VFZ81_14460 [Burkholderiales bacterium]